MVSRNNPHVAPATSKQALDVLPWPMLLVDLTGGIWGANPAAYRLLRQTPPQLVPSRLESYVTAASADALQELLHVAPREQLSTTMLSLRIDDTQAELTCVFQPLDNQHDPPLFALALLSSGAPNALPIALSVAIGRSFEATTPTEFLVTLQEAVASFGISLELALRHPVTAQWLWTTGVEGSDTFLGTSTTCPHPLKLMDLGTDSTVPVLSQAAASSRALHGRVFSRQTCLTLPLTSNNQHCGVLVASGPGLNEVTKPLFQSLGQLLGVAVERLQQRADMQLDQFQTSLLLTAGQAITAVTELDDVLRVICEQALNLSGGLTASLLTPEPEGEYLRCSMALGPDSELLLGQRSRLLDTLAGRVFGELHGQVVGDITAELAGDVFLAQVTQLRSVILLALRAQGRAVGVLAVWHHDPGFFGPLQQRILGQYSSAAAVAIENARLHEAMRRSEERYRTLFQNALEIVITLDFEGRIISWNRAALQFLGLSPAELRGGVLNIQELMLPEQAGVMAELQARALEGYAPVPTEIEMTRADGARAIVEITVQMFQERGQPHGVYIIGRDMTERRRQRQALTDKVAQLTALHKLSTALSTSLERATILQQAVEAIALANRFDCVGIYLLDADGAKLELTASTGMDAATQALVRQAEPTSIWWRVFCTERAYVAKTRDLAAPFQDVFQTLGICAYAILPLMAGSRAHGVIAIGRAETDTFSESETRVLQTMAAQIAQALENIQLYAEVERSAARYRDLYENANDFIGTMATDGKITSLNRAALHFFGYSNAEVRQLTLHDLLPPDDLVIAEDVLATLRQSVPAAGSRELRVVRKNGARAIVEIRSRLVVEDGTPTAIHFIARDITERRQLEAQVRQGEKLAALGQLAAGAAHELNNPLAVVLGTTQLLRRDPQAAAFREDIRNIEAAAQRAKHIIKQMLTFAREHEDVRGPVELSDLIERVLQGMRKGFDQHGIQVNLELERNLPPVWGDVYQLEQVFDNLLHNAAQALGDSNRSTRCINIAATIVGRMLRLSITDNGPGIAPHVLPRIFDPFFTTKEVGSGTGLGLSLVFGIVDKHGGSIRAESVYGQGATFVVDLPVSTASAAKTTPTAIRGPMNCTILVVEDECDVRLILERALTQYGYTVDVVESAEAALIKLTDKHYDLVITDMRMRGMSGRELFERVRVTQPQLNWVFVTGDTMSVSSESFLNQTGVPFLPKPFSLEELWEAVALSIVGNREPSKAA